MLMDTDAPQAQDGHPQRPTDSATDDTCLSGDQQKVRAACMGLETGSGLATLAVCKTGVCPDRWGSPDLWSRPVCQAVLLLAERVVGRQPLQPCMALS